MESLKKAAMAYGSLGWEMFPADPQTKSPLVSQYTATADTSQIAEWWDRWPEALIAHRVPPGNLILDVDPRHNGHETWKALVAVGMIDTSRVHLSGRGDGGMHVWFERTPDMEKLTTKELDAWAKQHGVGTDVGGRWSSGVDIIQRNHRYTILPPSPHPTTGKPYWWAEGKGFTQAPGRMPEHVARLLRPPAPAATDLDWRRVEDESIADWYSANHTISELLAGEGWELVSGAGDDDGSEWRHPHATSAVSATVRDNSLYVYSTSTVFEPTEPGVPVGYSPFATYATLKHAGDMSAAASAARTLKDGERTTTGGPQDDFFVDWETFWTKEREEDEWLHQDVLAKGRGHAIYAWQGTGKSLFTLWVALQVATGRNDVDVIYLDYEMTDSDLFERLSDMGMEGTNLSRLHYALLPMLPPLDTSDGVTDLMELVERVRSGPDGHVLVIIDTTGRATQGDENSNDTIRDFYRHAGIALKRAGCTWARIDHAGKDREKGQRGGSAKGDDVDVVWKLEAGEGKTVTLKRDKARMGWVKEKVTFEKLDEPLRYKAAPVTYTAEAIRIARELDRLGIPVEVSCRKAMGQARGEGVGGRDRQFREAVKLRRDPLRWPPENSYKPLENRAAVRAAVICPEPAAEPAAGDRDDL